MVLKNRVIYEKISKQFLKDYVALISDYKYVFEYV